MDNCIEVVGIRKVTYLENKGFEMIWSYKVRAGVHAGLFKETPELQEALEKYESENKGGWR